jgi:hypothetical protein
MAISRGVKTSLVYYPGKIASVVFTQVCNLISIFPLEATEKVPEDFKEQG